MKFKVTIGALVWAFLISGVHIQLNVGWSRLWHGVQVMRGQEREELIVGFLPVT